MVFASSSSRHTADFLDRLARQRAVLVQVESTQGSAPREAGCWMAVFEGDVLGTIGGGHVEHVAIARARAMLGAAAGAAEGARAQAAASAGASDAAGLAAPAAAIATARFALGPALGQCCGGVMHLRFEPVGAADAPALAARLNGALAPVALFGGGHVGQALAQVLAPLPFALTWIDSRDGIFPPVVPARVACEHSEPVQAAVPGLAPGSRVLVMSFSHAEDLEIVAACLRRQREKADLPYIGLIGSRTKWATFGRRLQARGFTGGDLAHVTCPIGIAGIAGKEPEVIAVAVAAQLLQTLGAP